MQSEGHNNRTCDTSKVEQTEKPFLLLPIVEKLIDENKCDGKHFVKMYNHSE